MKPLLLYLYTQGPFFVVCCAVISVFLERSLKETGFVISLFPVRGSCQFFLCQSFCIYCLLHSLFLFFCLAFAPFFYVRDGRRAKSTPFFSASMRICVGGDFWEGELRFSKFSQDNNFARNGAYGSKTITCDDI